jgi:uncharacterized membrane protein
MEPNQPKSASDMTEKADVDGDDVPLTSTMAPARPTTLWKRKILVTLLFIVTILGLWINRYTPTDKAMIVPGPYTGSIDGWIWAIKEMFGTVRVEYDTEAVASALLDQSESGR